MTLLHACQSTGGVDLLSAVYMIWSKCMLHFMLLLGESTHSRRDRKKGKVFCFTALLKKKNSFMLSERLLASGALWVTWAWFLSWAGTLKMLVSQFACLLLHNKITSSESCMPFNCRASLKVPWDHKPECWLLTESELYHKNDIFYELR